MLKEPIYISSLASISPLGSDAHTIWKGHTSSKHMFVQRLFDGSKTWCAPLPKQEWLRVQNLRQTNRNYSKLDNTVLYAILAARSAIEHAGWKDDTTFGVNIGSSRGASELFEHHHQNYLESKTTHPLTSPNTTLGNIASWVAHDLNSKGPVISHSITCSTALHAILNGVAWLQSGMADKFLVGGSEAPLTPFTIAQMKALKVYGDENFDSGLASPCGSLDFEKTKNAMVLGEAAAIACLQQERPKKPLAKIIGIGHATEVLQHGASLSVHGSCLKDAMKMALETQEKNTIDAIVMHAPGTVKGDASEYNAIQEIFDEKIPALTSNKWKIGHSFGASGMLNLEQALLMLQNQWFLPNPFLRQENPRELRKILVNAVGFGGNAVSILVEKG